MSARAKFKPETVRRCVARQGGGYMIVTASGSGVSPQEIPEGARVLIRDGQAQRCER
jgi:hypothetical protein